MKSCRFAIFTLFAALIAFPALALDLQEARTQGLVGEQLDGYIAAISSSPAAKDLAADVNAKRKAEYMRISKENGQPVAVTAKIAAEQIINNLPKGAMYKDASGSWKQR